MTTKAEDNDLVTNVRINQIRFITTLKGTVVPLLGIDKNEDIEKSEFDLNGIMFSDVSAMDEGIGYGAVVEVKFDKDGNPEVLNVVKQKEQPHLTPSNCNTCGELVAETIKGDIKCVNQFCPATSRGYLFQLLNIACKGIDPFSSTLILNNYPIGPDGPGSIDTFEEFQLAFGQMKSKKTQSRINHWKAVFGEQIGEKYWEYEIELETYLNSESLPSLDFWTICNFKNITEDEIALLAAITPRDLFRAVLTPEVQSLYDELSDRTRELIDNNMHFVSWLMNFFDSYGEKEWTSSTPH